MDPTSLTTIAATRGLLRLSEALAGYERKGWLQPGDPISPTIPTDTIQLLSYLARNGLEPRAVSALADEMEGRTLELGLLAWDALTGSLCGQDDYDYLTKLREWARAIASTLPASGRRGYPAWLMSALQPASTIAAPAFANANDEELLAGIMAHEIGAYERYRQANAQLLDVLRNEGFVDATVHVARILHLAHLPTLASFYDAYVSTAFEHEAALFDLCECLLDVAADGTPPLPPTVSVDWAAYVQARKVVVDGHALMAKAILATAGASDVPPETRGAAGLRLLSADLSVTFGGAASDVAVIEGIVRKYPLWRYAALVRARLLARGLPRETVPSRALFDGFVGTFGNDRVFAYALLVETAHKSKAWLEPVVRWLAAEALARPHDIEVWFAFAQFLDGDDGQLVAELSSAIETQSLLVD